MPDDIKNIFDVVTALGGGIGALVAFVFTLQTWKAGQRWQRAEKLDKFIEHFEKDSLLRLACLVLDWKSRKAEFDGKEFSFISEDALIALKLFGDEPGRTTRFSPTQAKIRDCYDAFLTFLCRLDAAIDAGLIDVAPVKRYFFYWVERMLSMDLHPDDARVLGKTSPSEAVARYIEEYGDPDAIASLARIMEVRFFRAQQAERSGALSDVATPSLPSRQP